MRNSFKGWEAPSSAKEKLSRSGLKSTTPAAGGTNGNVILTFDNQGNRIK
jgi:hypothetical protein